jgi:hypothetical protein
VLEGSLVGADERSFITHEEREGAALVDQRAESEAEAAALCRCSKPVQRFIFLEVEEVGFERGNAAETPAGDGQDVHEILFHIAGGLILGEVRFEERVEVLHGFIGEDVEAGGQAVPAGVLGGSGLALRCGGSLGFCAVGAGCVGSGSRCHG